MKDLEKDTLLQSRQLLQKLLETLCQKETHGYINYAIAELRDCIAYLNTQLSDPTEDYKDVKRHISCRYKRLLQVPGGLVDAHIWDDEVGVRDRKNQEFQALKKSIEQILLK